MSGKLQKHLWLTPRVYHNAVEMEFRCHTDAFRAPDVYELTLLYWVNHPAGGAEVVLHLVKEKMIDEFILSVLPVLPGDGIRLFKERAPELDLKLVSMKSFETGLVQIHYRKVKD